MIEAKSFSHVTFVTSDLERQIAYFTEVAGLVVAERENGLQTTLAEGVEMQNNSLPGIAPSG